jgi:hypothetical protein
MTYPKSHPSRKLAEKGIGNQSDSNAKEKPSNKKH